MRQQPERKASNGKYAKSKKNHDEVLGYLIIFLFMMMTAVGSYQIITRYFFNRPSTVSEELLTYSFTWMSLLASAMFRQERPYENGIYGR